MNVDEVLAKMDTLDANEKEIQYIIDENLRVISIPPLGVVIGVEGDKDVNSVKFKMVRYYKGIDLSKFEIRINFANANGDLSYYTVKNLTVTDDTLTFEWLVGYLVTQYKGTVRFIVRMITTDASTGEVQQAFDTTIGEARSLEGLLVDVPTDEKVYDIVAQLKTDLTDHVNNLLETIPEDYNELNKKVEDNTLGISKLKEDLEILNNGGLILKDEIINRDIENWLDEHPEATTTVEDGAITSTKFNEEVTKWTKDRISKYLDEGKVYIGLKFETEKYITEKAIFINCEFINTVRINESCSFLACTFVKPYECKIATTQKVDRLSFKDCVFVGELESTSSVTINYRLMLYANNLTFDNCHFTDTGIWVSSMDDISTSDYRGLVTISNCDFYKSPYETYITEKEDVEHIEFIQVAGRFKADINNCYFHDENGNFDSIDLYMCYSAKVNNCYFSVREGSTAIEAKSIYDGLEGGTWGGETSVAGASKMISITDCIFDFNGCTKFTRGIGGYTSAINNYKYVDDSIIKDKILYIDNCKGMNGSFFVVVDINNVNAQISNVFCDEYLKPEKNQNALRITEIDKLPFECTVYATNLFGNIRAEKFTKGECIIANSFIYLTSLTTNDDISGITFVNCKHTQSYMIYDNLGRASTLNFVECDLGAIYAPDCDINLKNCILSYFKEVKSAYMDNCRIKTLNVDTVTDNVTYTNIEYITLTCSDETKLIKDATYKVLN